jgi:F0F1-type ATP synthase epsilon subunit
MDTLHARLISPVRVVFDDEIRSVVISGIEGDKTVLPPGMIIAVDVEGVGRRASVRGGFVDITGTA